MIQTAKEGVVNYADSQGKYP